MINEGKRMELGSQIRRHRTERGLSQDDLAAKIYVSRQTVSSWENDKTYPDVQSLLLLSAIFDVSVDSLIKGDVATMKEIVENKDLAKRLQILATAGFAFIVIATILLAGGMSFWDWDMVPSLITWLLCFGIGCSLLWRVPPCRAAASRGRPACGLPTAPPPFRA